MAYSVTPFPGGSGGGTRGSGGVSFGIGAAFKGKGYKAAVGITNNSAKIGFSAGNKNFGVSTTLGVNKSGAISSNVGLKVGNFKVSVSAQSVVNDISNLF